MCAYNFVLSLKTIKCFFNMLANNNNTPQKRILLVDDDILNQRILSRILQAENYQIDIAFDGEIALQKIEEHDFFAVISDLNMPNLNGIQLIEKLLLRDVFIPIIFLTGETEIAVKNLLLAKGAHCFLSKPVDKESLLKHLDNIP